MILQTAARGARWVRNWRGPAACWQRAAFSKGVFVQPGNTLSIVSEVKWLQVEVVNQWQEHCTWSHSEDLHVRYEVDSDTSNVSMRVTPSLSGVAPGKMLLQLSLPEMIHVAIQAHSLKLKQVNKMMGDLMVACEDGEIDIDKVRGECISLQVGSGNVRVHRMLEGSVVLGCDRLEAKMINGQSLQLSANSCHIEAAYCGQAAALCQNDIRFDLFKGILQARSHAGNIIAHKLDGAFTIHAHSGEIDLQVNALVCTTSVAHASGQIHCLVDPEVKCNVSCSSHESEVVIDAPAFEGDQDGVAQVQKRSGRLLGQVRPPKRGMQSGKIDLAGAEAQALRDIATAAGTDVPSLCLEADQQVFLQSLSWMDVIRRKHGML